MRFIRTENGRIVDRLSDFNCFKSHGTTGRYIVRTLEDDNDLELWLKYNRTSVVKQANTIEELCDCKVYIPKNKNETPYLEYPCRKYDYLNEKYEIVYGAIWTDKGLIHVAKMNDEGELCLI